MKSAWMGAALIQLLCMVCAGGGQRLPAVEPLFGKTVKVPLVKVTGAGGSPIPAVMGHDGHGLSCVEVVSKGQLGVPGTQVLGLAADPAGEVLYAILPGDPLVTVLDPLTWKTVAEIPVPESPCAVWADSRLIAVACRTSNLVALIDAGTRQPLATVRCPDLPNFYPDTIAGRGPDGSLLTIWQQIDGHWTDRALVVVPPSGPARVIARNLDSDWATAVPGQQVLLLNGTFCSTSMGNPLLLVPGEPQQRITLCRSRYKDLLGTQLGFFSGVGPCFATADGKALAFPSLNLVKGVDSIMGTFLVSPAFDKLLTVLPGAALCEVPDQDLMVSLDREVVKAVPLDSTRVVALYVSRSSGRIQRVVHLSPPADPDRDSDWGNLLLPGMGAVYLPGRELLFVPKRWHGQHKAYEYTLYPCGPAQLPGQPVIVPGR